MKQPPVYILGGAQSDFARNWTKEGKHFVGVMRETVTDALDSAQNRAARSRDRARRQLRRRALLQAGPSRRVFPRNRSAVLGLPTSRHEAACASGSIAILAASAEIEAGRYDLAAVVGLEQMKTVDSATGGDFLGTAAWYERECKGMEYPVPALFGRLGDEYDKRYGLEGRTSRAHLGDQLLQRAAQPAGADAQLVHEREQSRSRQASSTR